MNARITGLLLAAGVLSLLLLAALPARADNLLTPERPLVKMTTNEGVIVVQLYPEHAPESVKNFLRYVREGFYDNTIFHRVERKFVIQGGGYTPDLQLKETWLPIPCESNNGLKNLEYTLGMARQGAPDSATSQFYINLKDNPPLDRKGDQPGAEGYAVFGRVVEGEKVVDKIGKAAVWKKKNLANLPVRPIIIEKARIVSSTSE